MTPGEAVQLVLAGVGGLVTVGGSVAVLRRRVSKDNTEIHKDKTEAEFVTRLLAERDEAIERAEEASKNRDSDRSAIARLEEQNRGQAREIERLQKEFEAFKRVTLRLYPNTRAFLQSDFAELDEAKPKPQSVELWDFPPIDREP